MPDALEPFDESDPFNIVCEHFRKTTLEHRLRAERITLFRDLEPMEQLQAFIVGTMTGLVGAAFASIYREGRDDIMQYFVDSLPFCRQQAEAMVDKAEAET